MRLRWSLLFTVILLCLSAYSPAQNWSGILDSSRAISWESGNYGIPGGIPARLTQCGSTIAAYTGTAATINTAIGACTSGQFVHLGTGTFNLSTGIDFTGKDNVTVRGDGPTNTKLIFTGAAGCAGLFASICLGNGHGVGPQYGDVQPGGPRAGAWTAGYAKGATSITLGAVANLSVGSLMVLDQLDDAGDTGGFFSCNMIPCSTDTGQNARPNRNQMQFVTVTSITGAGPYTVGITPGLYAPNWRSGQTPGAWWNQPAQTMDGVENLSLDNSATGGHTGIGIFDCFECWVKNVKSIVGLRNHVWIELSARVQVQDSYFYGTLGANSQSYGIEPMMTSDDYVVNNIFQHITSPIVSGVSPSGNIYAYNYEVDDYTIQSFTQATYGCHDEGSMYNLWEGNVSVGWFNDVIHGTCNANTIFRNRITGRDLGHANVHQADPIFLQSHNRFANVVGNVLGTAGFHTLYEFSCGTGGNSDGSIYVLGCSGAIGSLDASGSNVPPDPLVKSTLLRWGNYDTVNAAVQWNSAEIPTSGATYINGNSVPANHTLPSSFYLTSKPAWWGNTVPWPPVGPDVTGGNGPAGLSYQIPAELCYLNTMGGLTNGTSGVLNFDASVCYSSSAGGGGGAPAAPANLTGVVH
jgi:hypothetical protein